jgi:hypothetical protein
MLEWIGVITPSGAPVLRAPILDFPATGRPFVPDEVPGTARIIESCYEEALEQMGIGRVRSRRALVARLLAPPLHATGDLPVHFVNALPWADPLPVNLPAAFAASTPDLDDRKALLYKPVRRLIAAIKRDLRGETLEAISEYFAVGNPAGDNERVARGYVSGGRRYLAAIGAWP